MAQTSWPFENIDTTETQFSQWARNINEGIKQGSGSELAVTAPGGGMTIQVASGQAMIRGHYYSNTATETLTIAAANPTNNRIDAVVLELDPSANTVILKVLTGTPAGSPVAPSLTQTDSGIYQIRLANVLVEAATLTIESADITDLRSYMYAGVGKWTTAARPTNPVENETIGFNTTLDQHEYWDGSSWVPFTPADAVRVTELEATGDIIYASAAETPARLPIGTNGQVLRSNGTTPEWASNPNPLKVVQLEPGDNNLANDAGYIQFHAKFDYPGSIFIENNLATASFATDGATDAGSTFSYDADADLVVSYYPEWSTSVWTGATGAANINTALFDAGTYWAGVTYSATNTPGIQVSTNLTTWGSPTANQNLGLIDTWEFGNSTYIGVGVNGLYAYSTDGLTWTTGTAGTGDFRSIIFDGTQFIAGHSGNAVQITTNGTSWTNYSTVIDPNALTFGGGNYLAAQDFNNLAYSTNGTTWTTKVNTISTTSVRAAAFGNAVYVIAGDTGGLATATTPSGTWTARTSGFGTTDINGLAFGAGVFVAVGDAGQIRSSTNGITWTSRTSNTTSVIRGVNFVNNLFVANTATTTVLTSADGISWTPISTNTGLDNNAGYQNKIVWDGTKYFYIGDADVTVPSAMFSTNLSSWYHKNLIMLATTSIKIAKTNNLYLFSHQNSSDYFTQTSINGVDYYKHLSATMFGVAGIGARDVTYHIDKYIVVGAGATSGNGIATSTDGISWTSRSPITTNLLNGVASNGTVAVAVGTTQVVTSTDGITWTTSAVSLGNNSGIAYGNGRFVAFGENDTVRTSTDGITWATGPNFFFTTLPTGGGCVQFFGSNFYIFGGVNPTSATEIPVYTSTDGLTWSGRIINSFSAAGYKTINAFVASTPPVGFGTSGLQVVANDTLGGAKLFTANYGAVETL